MTRNVLDTAETRQVIGIRNTDNIIAAAAHATYMTLNDAAQLPDFNVRATIINCEFSTISLVVIWLQERGCAIPADILASLEIEGQANA